MNIYILSLSFIFSFSSIFSQETVRISEDSLNDLNFEDLKYIFKKDFSYKSKFNENYSRKLKAIRENVENEEELVFLYSLLFKLKNDISYLDSMIVVSKKISKPEYLLLGYSYKGNYLYTIGQYPAALKNYLMARKYTSDSSYISHTLNFNIGLLKLELEENQEAHKLFYDFKQHLEKTNQTKSVDYISSIYAIAYNYSKMNKIDSSDSLIKIGLNQIKKTEMKDNYSNLLLVSGINDYKRGDYNKSLETLARVSKLIKENSFNSQNLAISEYYMGKSYLKKNDVNFLNKFKVVDSIIMKTQNLTSELRGTYPILINYYSQQKNLEKQLFYIKNLLTVDSILNKNNAYLTTKINKSYDTPKLLKKKEILIKELDSKNNRLIWLSGLILVSLVIIIFLYTRSRKKIKYYEEKAKILTKKPTYIALPSGIFESKIKEKSTITFSNKKLKMLELKLAEFEEKKGFLNKNLTLDILAREFETNRVYVSKSVNELKGKSFSKYINELRILFIIEELKTNPNLQKYTIAGIADEAGFNNSESFTNAFKKITKTLPSYYIKALKNIN